MARVKAPAKQPPVTPQTDFGAKVRAHTRYYTSAGEQVPGVTTILGVLAKPALIGWANRMGLQGVDTSKYVDEAAAVGTLAHGMVMELLGGEHVRQDSFTADQITLANYGLEVFKKWRKGLTFKAEFLEKQLVSDEYRFGGTVDIVARIDDVLTIIDLKTSAGIYEEHIFQVGAYWKLLTEHGIFAGGARILRIGRSEGGELEERILSGVQVLNAWRVFEHCLEIYRLKKK